MVADAEREVAVLDTRREYLEAAVEDRAEEIAIVKDDLVANQRLIIEARTKAKGMDESAVLAEYRRLGYIK